MAEPSGETNGLYSHHRWFVCVWFHASSTVVFLLEQPAPEPLAASDPPTAIEDSDRHVDSVSLTILLVCVGQLPQDPRSF